MAMRYGHAWTSQYSGDGSEAGQVTEELAFAEWSKSLAGLSQTEIEAGHDRDRVRGKDWPPSASAFASMCRGVPTLAAVKLELRARVANQPCTPFVTLLYRQFLDSYTFTHETQRVANAVLEEAYELTVAWVMQGGRLPDAEPALPATVRQPESKVYPDMERVRTLLNDVNSKFAKDAAAEAAAAAERLTARAGATL